MTAVHPTVSNTSGQTRFSIDFRTVNLADVQLGQGAADRDSFPSGTALRDFRRAADLAAMPEEVVRSHDSRNVDESVAVFQPPGLASPDVDG